MKNKKIFAAVILLAAVALVFSSCAFKMNTEQEAHYEGFITGLETVAKVGDINKDLVKTTLDTANVVAAGLKYEIKDSSPDKPVTKGTTADDLKKRFKPAKKK